MRTISLNALRGLLKEQFEISPRTLAWYISEGLVPKPEHEGREGYYNLDKIDIINFVGALRMLNQEFGLSLRSASRLLARHQQHLQRLVDLLGGLATEYPMHLYQLTPETAAINMAHRTIRHRFFQQLQEATNLDHLSIVDIEDALREEWAAHPLDRHPGSKARGTPA